MPTDVKWRTCAHTAETTCITFNRDGSILYTGGGDGVIKSWDTQSGDHKQTFNLSRTILDVTASLDDEYIAATATDSNRIHLFRASTTTRFEMYSGHSNHVTSVCFNYSRKGLISASKDNTIRLWNISTTQHTSAQSPAPINNVDLSWSETVLVSTHMKDLRIWDLNSGKAQLVHTLQNAHLDQVTCARYTTDERYVISTGQDHLVKVWDVRMWKQAIEPAFSEGLLKCPTGATKTKLAISPDNRFVVVGSQNGAVVILDIKSNDGNAFEIGEIYDEQHTQAVIAAEWVPGKSSFASFDQSGSLMLWE